MEVRRSSKRKKNISNADSRSEKSGKTSDGEIKNVLVIGASGYETSRFIETFGAYLLCDTHEEAEKWKPKSHEYSYVYDDATDTSKATLQVGDKKFNFVHASKSDNQKEERVSKQLIIILLSYVRRQELTAIIFLVRPTTDRYDANGKYKCLFSGLGQFADRNIFYVCNSDFDKSERINKYMDALRVERNKFYFEESAFYEISGDNWQRSVEFSKNIYNRILELRDYHVQSVVPEKSLLTLANNLMMLLINTYICADYANISIAKYYNYRFSVRSFKRDVTVCYHCYTWIQRVDDDIKMIVPSICHIPCKCPESDDDITKCVVFSENLKLCNNCSCFMHEHSKMSFHVESIHRYEDRGDYAKGKLVNNEEKRIVVKTLSTCFLYKKQNQEKYEVEAKLSHSLHSLNDDHSAIYDNFMREFNEEASRLQRRHKSKPIPVGDVLISFKELFRIEEAATIIPYFVEDVFPEDFGLGIVGEQDKSVAEIEGDCETRGDNTNDKAEIEMLRNENTRIKRLLKNANDLNAKLVRGMETLTQQYRLGY